MNTVEILSIITNENPTARRVYSVASTGEIVIERNGKRGRANVTVLSHEEAEREALRLKATWPVAARAELPTKVGLRDFLAIITWAAELQVDVEAEVVKFFETQQMVWLHLEDIEEHPAAAEVVASGPMAELLAGETLNPIEDVTNSNSDPERYYPIVGTEVPANAPPPKEEVVNPVEVITELKQEAITLPVRVIEFKVNGSTFTRVVRKADKAAFASIKADIKKAIEDGSLCSTIQAIIPTVRVRPGFVYVRA